MTSEQHLKLEIWRELVRRDPREHRNFTGITQGGSLGALPTASQCADEAVTVYDALFKKKRPA